MPFDGWPRLAVHSGGTFRLLGDVTYKGANDDYIIPSGFVTDLASVPPSLRWLVNTYGTYTRAAILHDFLWGEHRAGRLVSRRDADGLFRRVMREEGTPFLQRWVMWAAVRIGDGFEGGMTAREWLAFAALLVPGAIVAVASLPAALVRAILWALAKVGIR